MIFLPLTQTSICLKPLAASGGTHGFVPIVSSLLHVPRKSLQRRLPGHIFIGGQNLLSCPKPTME